MASNFKKRFDLWFHVLLSLILSATLYFLVSKKTAPAVLKELGVPIPQIMKFPIRSVTVLQGHEFDLELSDGRRVLAKLDVNSVPSAKDEVIDLLSDCRSPTATLLSKSDSKWVVEIHMEVGPDLVDLSDWLKRNDLLYSD